MTPDETPLPSALSALGTWLIDLRDWLQTEYTRVGSPYGVDEAGLTQWLAEVATEIQRQQTQMPQEQTGSYDLGPLVVSAHVAHQQALALVTLFRDELGPTHPSTLQMETIVATLAEILQDRHQLDPSWSWTVTI